MTNQDLKNKPVKKSCPKCGRLLAIRENRETGSLFLGCTGYPDYCKYTEPLPQDILMEAVGAARLPGF